MDLPNLISGASQFPVLGMLGGILMPPPPHFEKVEGAYWFGLVRPSACSSVAKNKLQF